MTGNLKLRTDIGQTDKYIDYITNTYDIDVDKFSTTTIPLIDKHELENIEWNIGLICGGSGSGKSTILKNQFDKPLPIQYDETKPIISQFPNLNEEEVCDILESVGLSSVPTWLRKPHELSMGEKARLDICWYLINTPNDKLLILDEFTSTINREVAKSLSFALQRYIRKNNLKIVIASCHFDIIEFLQPDWIFNLNKKQNDKVELEYFRYTDSNYSNYPNVNKESILSNEYNI